MIDYSAIADYIMNKVRRAVIAAFKRSGMSRYQLAKRLDGKVPRSTVYSYLSNQKGRDIGSTSLEHLMHALGLEIRPKGK